MRENPGRKVPMRRCILVAVASVLLVACARSADTQGEQAPPPAPAAEKSVVFPTFTDAKTNCGGFAAAQAAEILGVGAAGIAEQAQDITPTSRGCSYIAGDRKVVFTLTLAESVDEAKRDFANMRDTYTISARAQEKATGKSIPEGAYSDILSVGDEGIWSVTNRSMAIRYKNLEILVMMPEDKRLQAAVAARILEHVK